MSDILNKAKDILNIENNRSNAFIEFCIQKITNGILDFCNIEQFPEKLETLIIDFIIEQYTLNKNGVGEGKQEISSVSDNGQNVSLKTIGGASQMSKNVDEFINNNKKILITYRKLRW